MEELLQTFRYDDIPFKANLIQKSEKFLVIAGYASVFLKDLQGEYLPPSTLKVAVEELFAREDARENKPNINVLHQSLKIGELMREYTTEKGEVLTTHVDDTGLFIIVKIYRDSKASEEVIKLIEAGHLRAFSIAGLSYPEDKQTVCQGNVCQVVVTKTELHEISLVGDNVNLPGPANQGSSFFVVKANFEHLWTDENIIPFKTTEKAAIGRVWDAKAAQERIFKWAGAGNKFSLAKYRQAFTLIDGDPNNSESYKVPHHDIIGGELKVVLSGVMAARRAIMGGVMRSGSGTPVTAALRHLDKHLKQFGKTPTKITAVNKEFIEEADIDENTVHIYKITDNILGDLSKNFKISEQFLYNSQSDIKSSDKKMTDPNESKPKEGDNSTATITVTTPDTSTANAPAITVTEGESKTDNKPIDPKEVLEALKKVSDDKEKMEKISPDLGELLVRIKAVLEQVIAASNSAAALPDDAKARHQGDCPEGQHMVDGECVPVEDDKKAKKPVKKPDKEKKPVEMEKSIEDNQKWLEARIEKAVEDFAKIVDEKILNLKKSLTPDSAHAATPGRKSDAPSGQEQTKPKFAELSFDEQTKLLKEI